MLGADTFELVCQVNGKVRDRVEAPPTRIAKTLEALALQRAERAQRTSTATRSSR